MQYYGQDPVGPIVVAVSIAFAILSFIVLSLRLYARCFVVRAIGADDVLIIIACLLSWAFIVVTILSTQHGLGSHIESVPLTEFYPYLQIVWLSSIFYNACLGFIKTSVLALYMRLGDPTLKRLAMVMMVVVGCQASANVLVCLFQCNPISKAWDLTITSGHCVNIDAFYLANAALNILTDCLTYILPVGLLRHLQMPLRQKIGVGVMLCLGFFACLSSIVRITFVPALLASADATYDISPAMYWSVIETNVGILAASIPSFKSLAKRYLPRLIGDYGSKSDTAMAGSHQKNTFSRSGNMQSDTSRSGFVEIDEHNTHLKRPNDISMDNLYGVAHGGIDTMVDIGKKGGKGAASVASSEEMIIPPAGKILAKTHISISSDN